MTASVAALLRAAALGEPPPADGAVRVLPAPRGRAQAVLGFTAHHVVAADVAEGEVAVRLKAGDLGAPLKARFLAWLGERLDADEGSLDVVLAAPPAPAAEPPVALVERPDLLHARVARAQAFRDDVRVLADAGAHGTVILGRGLAGRWEVAFEVDPAHRGRGLGRALAAAARHHVPDTEPLFAQTAPGNVASLRALLAAGFAPLGAEVLFLPR